MNYGIILAVIKAMRIFSAILLSIVFTVPLLAHKILFHYTKDETAGNADWIPDRDFPFPVPFSPDKETDWDGATSSFAVEIVRALQDTVFILHGYPITYNDSTNPYDLSNFDVYVIPEPQNPFTQSEKEAIRKFVENGGGLFLIADHNNSDRNHSGWDSPRIFNDLGSAELFGMHFNITGESDNYFTYTSYNIEDFAPVTSGPSGSVTALAFHGGTSITLKPDFNQHVKGIVFKNPDHTGCMFAISKYGKGKIAGIGDSSPLDDGTGDPHDRLYNGWQEVGDSHKNLFMNTLVWLLQRDEDSQSFVLDGAIDTVSMYLGGNGNLSVYTGKMDSLFYVGVKFTPSERNILYILISSSPYDSVPVPWGRGGYIGNFNFYVSYSFSAHTVNIRDEYGLSVNTDLLYATSDSVFEIVFPKNAISSENFHIFTGIFSTTSFKIESSFPAIDYTTGIPHCSYIQTQFSDISVEQPLKPPIISQGFISDGAFTQNPITVNTIVLDDDVESVRMFYRTGTSNFIGLSPSSIQGQYYYFSIPPMEDHGIIEYYFVASDQSGNTSISLIDTINVIAYPYTVYFEEDTLIEKLSHFIDSAHSSIDICMYEVFNQEVVNSLINAHQHGIRVRVITDSTYFNRNGITSLINAGIPVIHEGMGNNSSNHIMHNKFVIRDFYDSDTTNDFLWTGSFNASDEQHVDNVLIVKSHTLASVYEDEFNQMWGSENENPDIQNSRTGRRKSDVLPFHTVNIGQSPASVYFSPQDSAIQYIINLVNRAQNSIYYLIFSFTREDLKDALIEAHNRGVEVKGVHEDNTRDDVRLNTVFNDLRSGGCRVYWAQVPAGYTFLHDKIMIIDSQYVITGSMNWTQSANDDNDENVLIIKDRRLAIKYLNKFQEVYDYSKRPSIDATQMAIKDQNTAIIYSDMLKLPKDVYDIFTISGQKLQSPEKISQGIYFLKNKKSKTIKKILILRQQH